MSDGVTSVSESLKQETYSHLKKVTRDIKVIPNFIDFTRFSKQNREHFKKAIAPNGEKLVVHTSNFRKVKRIDDAVKVFAEIIKKMPAKLLLIGDGPERVNIEKLCRDLNLGSSVTFLGKQNQVEEILSVCDLFLMPSETESFGLAALEAMACELPVISSNAGGIPELNVEGVTGFLCDVGNVATMAEKAIYILEDCERLLKFKGAALERAKEFDIHEIVPIYEEYYLEVLKKVNKTLTAK